MKSKAPLALMEQIVMVLVFALAAALCLQAFTWSDSQSKKNEARDQALIRVESAVETIKHFQGDFEKAADSFGGQWNGSCWKIGYDKNWKEIEPGGKVEYLLTVKPQESGLPLLGQARAEMSSRNGERLFSLNICWQEVERNE